MDIVTLGAALNGSAEYVNSHFKGGSNIQIVDNPDGTQTINASGEVSSEDTVARAEIAEMKDGENLDSFGDVETAIATKANADNVYKLALTTDDLLPANTDLDNVKTVGCYYVYESVNVTTITHRPTGNTSAFRVAVELAAGKSRSRQIYQEFNSYDKYIRYETSSGTWAAWKKVEADLSTKQDTISDLSTIRSGAALGATAVQPETGKGLSTNDYTTAEKTKLAGIAEGAEVNVQSNWAQTTTTADDYIKNKPTLGTAAAKNATDTYNSTGDDVTTGKAVAAALATLPEPMVFKGSLGTGGTITTLPTASSSNKGYVYKVITAGTYASQSAKVGDTFISDGSAWVIIPSGDEPSGTVTNVAVANGGGLTVSGSPVTSSGTITVGHSNSVTAKTSSSLKKFTYDEHGHVTDSSELSTAESDALASGIDSTKVEQIETNKNNILSIYDTGYAQKNVMRIVLDEVKALLPSQPFVGNTTTFGNLSVTFNEDNSITLNGSHTAAVVINFKDLSHINMPTNAVGAASANITLSNDIFFGLWGDSGVSNLVLNNGVDIPSDYAIKYSRGFIIRVSANTVCNNVRIYPMVCDKALYQASSEVVPYALPNTVLTPALADTVDNIGKNKFDISLLNIGINAVINTTTGTVTQGSEDTKTNLQFAFKSLSGSTIISDLAPLTTIQTNGVYAFEFTKVSTFDTIRFGHNGSSMDFNVKYPVSNLINGKNYVLQLNILNCVQANGKYSFNQIMLCDAELWKVSQNYQPYAMSIAEITAWILTHS